MIQYKYDALGRRIVGSLAGSPAYISRICEDAGTHSVTPQGVRFSPTLLFPLGLWRAAKSCSAVWRWLFSHKEPNRAYSPGLGRCVK
ncbi:hypothetical protein [Sedimentisphaera cyanobacteriorum]|uniref:hypothetical protein n=1 Tax=Sedimentisphaera cyanobacteriorum TaxID=1940790 RepID=UPI000F4E8AE5|nr:hypothetical protein [Sedimentisphaera cyanobacteriorum]